MFVDSKGAVLIRKVLLMCLTPTERSIVQRRLSEERGLKEGVTWQIALGAAIWKLSFRLD